MAKLEDKPWKVTFSVFDDKYFYHIHFTEGDNLRLQISKVSLEYNYFNYVTGRSMWVTQPIHLLICDFIKLIKSNKSLPSGIYTRTYK